MQRPRAVDPSPSGSPAEPSDGSAAKTSSRPLRGLVRFFLAGMLSLHVLIFLGFQERISSGYPDFTVFYTAAKIVRAGLGHQLYNPQTQYSFQEEFAGNVNSRRGPLPYIHPAFEALLFVPLTFLPYRTAFALWDMSNVILLVWIAVVLRRQLCLANVSTGELVAGFLTFFPVFLTLLQGQDSILLLFLLVLAFGAMKSDHQALAGVWLALSTFKFQFTIPLVLLFILWGRKKLVAGFLSSAVLLIGLSFLIVGWDGMLSYPGYALNIAKFAGLGGVPSELMPNLRGLLEGWQWGSLSRLASIAGVAAAAMILAGAWRKGPKQPQTDVRVQFSLAVVLCALVSWHTNAHDLSILVLPILLMYSYAAEARVPVLRLMLPALPLLLSPLWFGLWLGVSKLNLMAIPLLWWAWKIGCESEHAKHDTMVLRA